ncbi:MAG: AmmeMemoRadiSam system protein B [Atribacterota bacterium]|nr:AmmeMemoRadiSam system protein B [Atribacterota bacterium]MDD5636284.1 AmmeMemoRadiSam system protein B [Atribacterota bacterium]
MEHKRRAVVAGSFYAANRKSLYQQIKDCFLHQIGPQALPTKNEKRDRKIMGIISPHAGFMFSGPVAAYNYLQLSLEKTPPIIIILGPNHRGLGGDISLMSSGQWETPLGMIEIDQLIASEMLAHDEKKMIQDDFQAHLFEHSIEVQLPFLQFIYPANEYKIIPICVTNQQLSLMKYLTDIIYKTIKDNYSAFLLIASSDFNHYEDQESTKRKDAEGIKQILNMDTGLFYKTIQENGASICGPGTISVVMETCKRLGINRGKLLKYATSGDVSGMNDQVVGYASIIFQ